MYISLKVAITLALSHHYQNKIRNTTYTYDAIEVNLPLKNFQSHHHSSVFLTYSPVF